MSATNPRSNKREPLRRPLLVIDGDSFAHRAYHALPKNILRDRDRPAGAILGFANRLVQLYRTERPRAVLVGWDTLEAATYRHEAFPAYKSGRHFDDELIEQLELIPKFVAACGFKFRNQFKLLDELVVEVTAALIGRKSFVPVGLRFERIPADEYRARPLGAIELQQ